MKILKKLPTEQTVDVKCDICGESCRGQYNIEYAELRANWGYDSTRDGERHECQMCEKCYNRVEEFIISIGGKIQYGHKRDIWQTPGG